jgi:hypothetical protein
MQGERLHAARDDLIGYAEFVERMATRVPLLPAPRTFGKIFANIHPNIARRVPPPSDPAPCPRLIK